MDLLAKFDAVTVKQDSLISEKDKAICAAHQAAYDAARNAMQKLTYVWESILTEQKTALQGTDASSESYLNSSSLRLSVSDIKQHMASLHKTFIGHLVRYFNSVYHIDASTQRIEENLLPERPDRYSNNLEIIEQHEKEMQSLSLNSEQIIEQIMAQMDGRSFGEQALHELKIRCHDAVWNRSAGKANYTRSKNVLHFTRYACSYENWMEQERWELSNSIKNVLRGVAHFETGSFAITPHTLICLLGYHTSEKDIIEFTDCQKITHLRMFKNGRVDMKFKTEEFARQFSTNYLGVVC